MNMKLKKLITIFVALIMSISIAVPITAHNVQADYIVSDSDYHVINAAKAIGAGIVIGKLGVMGLNAYHTYKTARQREAWKRNHTQIHVAVRKAYLYRANGKRWGKKYYLSDRGHTYAVNYVAPKYVYRIKRGRHSFLAYKFGLLHGKPMFLPIHDMAWTHVDDGD